MSSNDATLGVHVDRPSFCKRLLVGVVRIVAMRGVGCDFSVVQGVSVSSWKTFRTGGMRRSVCGVWLVTYHGALVICRRVFAWYRWITANLEAAVQPHMASPYVHIGFSTVL